jgi:hypothetical protein
MSMVQGYRWRGSANWERAGREIGRSRFDGLYRCGFRGGGGRGGYHFGYQKVEEG